MSFLVYLGAFSCGLCAVFHSTAYILADSGYDVWMGNARGNTYSRAHVSLSTKDSAFWNFRYQSRPSASSRQV